MKTETYQTNEVSIEIPVEPNYDDPIVVYHKDGSVLHKGLLDGVTDFHDGSWGITLKLPRPTWKKILLGWLIGNWKIVEYRG